MSAISDIERRTFAIGSGEGASYVIPSGERLSTITFVFDHLQQPCYVKLRHVEVRACNDSNQRMLGAINDGMSPPCPWLWLQAGSDSLKLFIKAQTIDSAVGRLKNPQQRIIVQRAVDSFFGVRGQGLGAEGCRKPVRALFGFPESKTILASIEKRFKISTAMCPNLSIVALQELYRGRHKVHRVATILYSEGGLQIGQKLILTKSPEGDWDKDLDLEYRAISALPPDRVPNVVRSVRVMRGVGNEAYWSRVDREGWRNRIGIEDCWRETGDESFLSSISGMACWRKIGLVSRFFDEGDLLNCVMSPTSSLICRKPQILMALRIAETLCQIHSCGWVYGDVRLENIVLHRNGGDLYPYFCDFGLAGTIDSCVSRALGTFSPPEGLGLREKRIAPSIDSWAFGVVLFVLTHRPSDDVIEKFSFDNGGTSVLMAQHRLLQSLKEEDPVDILIRALLDLDPLKRPSMAFVARVLEELL